MKNNILNKLNVILLMIVLIFSLSKAHSQGNSDDVLMKSFNHMFINEFEKEARDYEVKFNLYINFTKGECSLTTLYPVEPFRNNLKLVEYNLYESYIHIVVVKEGYSPTDLYYDINANMLYHKVDKTWFIYFDKYNSDLESGFPIGKEELKKSFNYYF